MKAKGARPRTRHRGGPRKDIVLEPVFSEASTARLGPFPRRPGLGGARAERAAARPGEQAGLLMALFYCAEVAGPHTHHEVPRLEPARKEAARLIVELHDAAQRPRGSRPN
ncbi:hypothetical protein GCM10017779_58270 [Streptomyces capillispiralis]|nr:hypothetical protein GCM10017779_58270 [Streptomyces capillispiralis]